MDVDAAQQPTIEDVEAILFRVYLEAGSAAFYVPESRQADLAKLLADSEALRTRIEKADSLRRSTPLTR